MTTRKAAEILAPVERDVPEYAASIRVPSEPRKSVRVGEIALALAQRKPSEPVSTITLSLNAKGDVQISVDVDDADPSRAAEKAVELFDALLAKYPRNGDGQ